MGCWWLLLLFMYQYQTLNSLRQANEQLIQEKTYLELEAIVFYSLFFLFLMHNM